MQTYFFLNKVSPEDSLPSMICKKCESYLNIAYTFKVVCIWVDSKLRNRSDHTPFNLNTLELYEKLQVECSRNEYYKNPISEVFKIFYSDAHTLLKDDDYYSKTYKIPDDEQTNNLPSSIIHNEINSDLIGDFISRSITLSSEETNSSSQQEKRFDVIIDNESLRKFEKDGQHNLDLNNSNSDLVDGVEDNRLVISTPEELAIEVVDALGFNYDYCQNFNDNKAVYRRVSLNSEDPLLLNIINKDLDTNKENNELKSLCRELKKVKHVNLNNIPLRDFESFEKQQMTKMEIEDRSVKSNYSSRISDMKTENRVGRHIAKKNAGQPPKRYSPTLELTKCPFTHQMQKTNKDDSSITKTKCDITDEYDENSQKKVEFKDVSDILHHEYILEDDLSMPEPIFEETIVTDSFYFTHDDDHTQKFNQNSCDNQQCKNSITTSKKKCHKEISRKLKFGYTACEMGKTVCTNDSKCDHKSNRKNNINNSTLQTSTLNKRKCKKRGQQKLVQTDTTCKICNKSFPFPSHLQRHLTAHIGIKRFTCKYCDKQFLHRYNLSVHIRSHTGNFPLHCNVCSRGFASPSVLERHQRSHTGETPFQCHYCLQLFSHASSLTMHERMHLNRPSFTCEICFKVFSYKSSLTAHKKGHSGFKPHSCNVCHKKFTRKTSVLRHMLCHSEVKKCKICNQSFNNQNSLIQHRRTHKISSI